MATEISRKTGRPVDPRKRWTHARKLKFQRTMRAKRRAMAATPEPKKEESAAAPASAMKNGQFFPLAIIPDRKKQVVVRKGTAASKQTIDDARLQLALDVCRLFELILTR